MKTLAAQDPEVYSAIVGEFRRQQDELELIASENYVSRAVLEAQGTVLTNKYAEGLPGKRYYGGCEYVDKVESLARDRVKALFGAPAANVQPHSGAQANAAVYLAAMKPGDTLLGLELSHGGHLTHGSPVNSSGKLYKGVSYGVDAVTGRIDMNRVREIAREHRPRMIVCGFSAYPRPLDFAAFRSIADEVGAVLLADIAHIAGIVVAGFHENPMPHCHFVTTTTHKTLRGPRGGVVMSDASWGVEMNKAVFPGTQGGPLEHVIAAKAVAFAEAQRPEFRDYIAAVLDNACAMSDRLQERGLKLVTDGTENHLMLVDLGETCSGKEAEDALGRAGMTANKNTVPGEKRSPFVTSGLRVGTAAMTTRGMRRSEATWVADRIADAIEARSDGDRLARIRADVHTMCARFPMYPESLVSGD